MSVFMPSGTRKRVKAFLHLLHRHFVDSNDTSIRVIGKRRTGMKSSVIDV